MNYLALLLLFQVAHTHRNTKAPVPRVPRTAPSVPKGIYGTWQAEDKSVISIFPCGVTNGQGGEPGVACVRLLQPAAGKDPDARDAKNPDPHERQRPVSPELIGTGFALTDPNDAPKGKLYNPYNGRTYKSTIKLEDNQLKLHSSRFLFFGHTLVCHRVAQSKPSPYKP